MTHPFEPAPLPDQTTSAELNAAWDRIDLVLAADPAEVSDGQSLIRELGGVATAISHMVLSRGSVQVLDLTVSPSYDPRTMPSQLTRNILSKDIAMESPYRHCFVGQADRGFGVEMGVYRVRGDTSAATHRITIPHDRWLAALFATEPCLWEDDNINALDYRSGTPQQFKPFNSLNLQDDTAKRYFQILQELSAELLKAAGQR